MCQIDASVDLRSDGRVFFGEMNTMNLWYTESKEELGASRGPVVNDGKRLRVGRIAFVCRVLCFAIAGVAMIGCDQKPPVDASAPPVFGEGKVEGVVKFPGTPPERRFLDNSNCHTQMPKAIQERTIVVGADQGLADVVLWLADAPASNGASRPRVMLDQIDCEYVPHVVAVQVGQTLRVTTSDEVFHNTHYNSFENGSLNFGLPNRGDFRDLQFRNPEFLRVRCDVHPWMSAQVAVLPNPFFAVSNEDGKFTIEGVPPGEYTLVARHDMLGERRTKITVGASAGEAVLMEFAAPD